MTVSRKCKYCSKYFQPKCKSSRQKFCGVDCSIKFRLKAGWNSKPEMIANRIGVGSRSKSNRKETWRNVDSM